LIADNPFHAAVQLVPDPEPPLGRTYQLAALALLAMAKSEKRKNKEKVIIPVFLILFIVFIFIIKLGFRV
jgi:hypothetical protein